MLASACGVPGPIAQNWRVLRSYTAAATTPLRPARYDVMAGVNGSGRDERPAEWSAGDTAGDGVGGTADDVGGTAAAVHETEVRAHELPQGAGVGRILRVDLDARAALQIVDGHSRCRS